MLYKGQGGLKDLGQARESYEKAAGNGHAKSMLNLALMYENCEGMSEPNYKNAIKHYENYLKLNTRNEDYDQRLKNKITELQTIKNPGFFRRGYDKVRCWF